MTGQKTWVVGEEVLAPDFNNYVQTQVVPQFATAAARDAWASPPNGALCVTVDANLLWQRIAGAWVLIGGRRIGFGAINPGQSWLTGQTFSMNWPQESWDTDNFGAGGAAITVPTGFDGIYSISAYIAGSVLMNGNTAVQLVVAGGFVAQSYIPINGGSVSVAAIAAMNAGQNCQVQIINGHSASVSYSGQFRMERISP